MQTLIAALFNFTFNPPTGGRSSLLPVWPSDCAPLTSWRSGRSIIARLYPFVSGVRSLSLCSCYNNACKLCLVPPAVPHKLHRENSISARGAALITGNQSRMSPLCLGPVAICLASQDACVLCGPLECPSDVRSERPDENDAPG